MRILALLLLSLVPLQAELITAIRKTDWTPNVRVGVPGGIINRTGPIINVTAAPYNAPVNTSSDCQPAIQAAINAAPDGAVIFMPAGTYRLNSAISMGPATDNRTLRGAGMALTILDNRSGADGVVVGAGQGISWDNPGVSDGSVAMGLLVTAGGGKNSNSITVTNGTNFSAGQLIKMAWGNRTENALIQAGAVPLGQGRPYNIYNGTGTGIEQKTMVTAKSGNVLTIFPPIIGDYGDIAASSNRQKGMKALLPSNYGTTGTSADGKPPSFVGLEGFTVLSTAVSTPRGVAMGGTYASWIVDVRSEGPTSYPFQFIDSLMLEIRHCRAGQSGAGGTNGAGYLFNFTNNCLVYDNIVENSFPGFEINFGSSGNVFAYNFGKDTGDKMYLMHGVNNTCNLFEGNVGTSIVSDGYFGNSSEDTVFRNWWTGEGGYSTSFKRFTRNANLIGNVLGRDSDGPYGTPIFSYGQPNIGNGQWTGDATPSAGDFWNDWGATGTLTARTSNTTGTLTINPPAQTRVLEGSQYFFIMWNNRDSFFHCLALFGQSNPSVVTFEAGYGGATGPLPPAGTAVEIGFITDGFQEMDHDVRLTSIEKANWAPGHGYVVGALGADTLPNSLYLAAKPTWFGNLTWPPFNPVTGQTKSYTAIPAGYRYVNGADPPGGPPDTTAPTLLSKVINAAGTQIALGFSETVSVGLGGSGGWTLNMTGGAVTVTGSPVVSGNTITWNLSRTIGAGQTGTISYVQPGNGVEDVAGNDLASLSNSAVTNTASGDGVAPTPNPSTFGIAPTATNSTTITMTATTATDAGTPPVQYFFNEVSGNAGGSDSGWQSSSTFTDTGLAAGTQYRYRVQARDSAVPPNVTTFSTEFSATTKSVAGAHPAMPFNVARANIVTP